MEMKNHKSSSCESKVISMQKLLALHQSVRPPTVQFRTVSPDTLIVSCGLILNCKSQKNISQASPRIHMKKSWYNLKVLKTPSKSHNRNR